VPPTKLYPRTALALLTTLNLLNYIDRSVLLQCSRWCSRSSTSATRRWDISPALSSGSIWSGAICRSVGRSLFAQADHRARRNFLERTDAAHRLHSYLLGVAGAAYPGRRGRSDLRDHRTTFVADLFPENRRGRIFGVFYLAIPVGTAAGYLLGGKLGPDFGWRFLLYRSRPRLPAGAGCCLSPGTSARPIRLLKETPARGTILGLARNPAFWAVTLGMPRAHFLSGEFRCGCQLFSRSPADTV